VGAASESDGTAPFVCECGRIECLVVLRLTVEEYEQGRQNPRWFLCAPGHEITGDDIGRVVQRAPDFVVVEKLGVGGKVAEQADSRPEAATRERA